MAAKLILLSAALCAAFPVQAAVAGAAPAPVPYAFATTPGRLPKNVVPVDYVVSIRPNAASLTLSGTESVTLEFSQATDLIQFNSLNQTLSHVLFDGRPVKSVRSDDTAQLTTVMLGKPATTGRHTLQFAYTGKIETAPHGLFAQEYVRPDSGKEMLLTTQFEATDARRMFPCWDEPAFRATIQLNATLPAALLTVSNMPLARRVVHGSGGNLSKTSWRRAYVIAYRCAGVRVGVRVCGWSCGAGKVGRTVGTWHS